MIAGTGNGMGTGRDGGRGCDGDERGADGETTTAKTEQFESNSRAIREQDESKTRARRERHDSRATESL